MILPTENLQHPRLDGKSMAKPVMRQVESSDSTNFFCRLIARYVKD